MSVLPVELLIDGLKGMAHAQRAEWLTRAHAIEGLPRITISEAGESGAVLASAARSVARTARFTHESNETDLRGVLLALAVCLQNELNAADAARRPRRYYAEG